MARKTPSEFTWRDRIASEVAAQKHQKRRGRRVARFTLEIPPGGLLALIVKAATRRGLSPTGYVRRATLALVAYDLGMPVRQVLAYDPRFSSAINPGNPIDDPAGALGGPWQILDMED